MHLVGVAAGRRHGPGANGSSRPPPPLPPLRPLAACAQNVASANDSGNTALHWACLMGHEAVTQLLLEAGASPYALNKSVRRSGPRLLLGRRGDSSRPPAPRAARATHPLTAAHRLSAPPSPLSRPARMENTPMDEALGRGHQALQALINAHSAPAKDVDEVRQKHRGRSESRGQPILTDVVRDAAGQRGEPGLLTHNPVCASLQADDVPDDAEEAGEEADMVLEGSSSIAEQQHGDGQPAP